MARNFYYGADASMVTGSAVFNAGINADPAELGLTSAQALAYSDVDAALQSAYCLAVNPATNSAVAVTSKNDAMKAMQRMAKDLSTIIRATPTVTDTQLMSLGLLPRPQRTRRNVPDGPPTVRVLSVVGRIVSVRVCDRGSASGRSKPFGARGAEIYWYVGEQPAGKRSDYRYEGFTGRTTTQITFPNDLASGATVWLTARWVSARGETSTASNPISFTLQGGPILPAQPQLMRAAA